MLVFRQLFDPVSSTYTYLLADRSSGEALLIDPVFEQVPRDGALICELDLRLVASVDTHVHADHVTGAWLLHERCGSAIAVSAASGAHGPTRALQHGDRIAFGPRWIEARATPGHTDGCMSFVLDDCSMAFTGDCLLIRGSGRTDFQQGDAHRMFHSVREQLFTLPDDCLLYPGHDYRGLTVSSVGEEKRFNPRLAEHVGEADFAGYMAHLHLPHPRQIAVAVPANLKCGRPDAPSQTDRVQDWAPLNFTFAGIWEISPQALEETSAAIQIVDVREGEEFLGALGHIAGARPMALGELHVRALELDRNRPVVCVCRSGARSAQAVVLLQKAGFEKVANLAGGMLRWRSEGHGVEAGTP